MSNATFVVAVAVEIEQDRLALRIEPGETSRQRPALVPHDRPILVEEARRQGTAGSMHSDVDGTPRRRRCGGDVLSGITRPQGALRRCADDRRVFALGAGFQPLQSGVEAVARPLESEISVIELIRCDRSGFGGRAIWLATDNRAGSASGVKRANSTASTR